MTDTDMTLNEAAAALGVHYMTAYRYVRLGQLTATKSGGTWHVSSSDLDEFRRAGSSGEPAERGGRPKAPWSDRLQTRLLAGDARGAWNVIEAAMAAGVEPEDVYLTVLSPALAKIGQQWAMGDIDISVEHRASGIVMRLMGRLGPRFVRRGRTRGAIVVGAPAGERHAIPVAMLADLIRLRGWEVSDLGADVPEGSFVHAVLTTPDVVAVGVSVTTGDHLDAAARSLAAMREAAPEVLLVVGGAGVRDEEHALALGADGLARDGAGFVALLEAAHGATSSAPVDPA